MELSYVRKEKLPRLAWCCELEKNARSAIVTHGPSVEAKSDFFFEGAWAGSFGDGDFLNNISFGTGARLQDSNIIFSCPDHIIDRVFLIRDENKIIVSNSLAFLLTASGETLDPAHLGYAFDLGAIAEGLKNCHGTIRSQRGRLVELFYYHNFAIDKNLDLTTITKERNASFFDFSTYKSFLTDTLRAIFENASDSQRMVKYEPLATVSSGYDSNTIAALAAPIGCKCAITFAEARGKHILNDSGADIATKLGLSVKICDRLGYRAPDDLPEVETCGVASEFSAVREDIENSVLLVGFMGDSVWERSLASLSSDLAWTLIAGQNLAELRLARGFIYLPAAFIGARELAKINKISRSKEMRPWTLYNSYDRPICRRILEEAGIPRSAFGQEKKAAGVFYQIEGLRETMTAASYESYSAYLRRHWNARNKIMSALSRILHPVSAINAAVAKRIFKLTDRMLGRGIVVPSIFSQRVRITRGILLLQWSIEKMQERYARAVKY